MRGGRRRGRMNRNMIWGVGRGSKRIGERGGGENDDGIEKKVIWRKRRKGKSYRGIKGRE